MSSSKARGPSSYHAAMGHSSNTKYCGINNLSEASKEGERSVQGNHGTAVRRRGAHAVYGARAGLFGGEGVRRWG